MWQRLSEMFSSLPPYTDERWNQLTQNWTGSDEDRKQLSDLVEVGFPDEVRIQVWKRLVDYTRLKENNPGKYQQLVESNPTYREREVEVDHPRTFPTHKKYRPNEGIPNAARIMKCFLAYEQERATNAGISPLDYLSGMSWFSSMAALYTETEEDGFWFLVKLFDSPLRELMHPEHHDALLKEIHLHKIYRRIFFPDLDRRLDQLGMSEQMYAIAPFRQGWMGDVFEVGVRVWDFWLRDQMKLRVFHSMLIGKLADLRQPILNSHTFDEVATLLLRNNEFKPDVRKVLSQYRITTTMANQAEGEWGSTIAIPCPNSKSARSLTG